MRSHFLLILILFLAACSQQTAPQTQSSIVFATVTPTVTSTDVDDAAPFGSASPAVSFANGLQFSNQTTAANIDLTHTIALHRKDDGATMMGGAVAGDFNNDGWQDLFAIGGGLEFDGLFINQGDGTFENKAEAAGMAELHVGSGAAVGDYNGDGWLDIYVTSFGPLGFMGPGQNRLYRNNGDLTFTDVAEEAGVNQTSPTMADGFGAAFGDYDLDGDLDLFVTGWRKDSHGNRLFQNNGDGTFADVTTQAGIIDNGIRGFSPCFADMNGDRNPELLLVADFGTSRYFVNNGDGSFTESGKQLGAGMEWSGMGSTVGDFNNDGRLDWYATAIFDNEYSGRGDGNKLYFNQGKKFIEAAETTGVNDGGWGWGAIAVDLNHDGLLDLVETNGWEDLPAYRNEPSKLWLNHGTMFEEVAQATGFDHALDGRGLLNFDYDNDGDQDMVVTTLNESLFLYRNDLNGSGTNWLRVFLNTSAHKHLAPNGFGSRVRITIDDKTYYRDIVGCDNYLSQSELSAHFGLGDAQLIDELRIEWPDGSVTTRTGIEVNQTLTIAPE
ncbi:MAG: CRTAC1 family protein [Anaerolineae bacterium]|nr:CRTAC1 family protein [Anaerolineae bacterium]